MKKDYIFEIKILTPDLNTRLVPVFIHSLQSGIQSTVHKK
jgi:hypothetical protein